MEGLREDHAGFLWSVVQEAAGPLLLVGPDRQILALTKGAADLIGTEASEGALPCDRLLRPVIDGGQPRCCDDAIFPAEGPSRWRSWLLRGADEACVPVWGRSEPIRIGTRLAGWVVRLSELHDRAPFYPQRPRASQFRDDSMRRLLTQEASSDPFGSLLDDIRAWTETAFVGCLSSRSGEAAWLAVSGTLPMSAREKDVLRLLGSLCTPGGPGHSFVYSVPGTGSEPLELSLFPVRGGADSSIHLAVADLPEGVTPAVEAGIMAATAVLGILLALWQYRADLDAAVRRTARRQMVATWQSYRLELAEHVQELERCLRREPGSASAAALTRLRARIERLPLDDEAVEPPIPGAGTRLTRRQREIVRLASLGWTDAAIAKSLGLSIHTVKNHMRHVLARLEARNRAEAVARFMESAAARA